MDDKRRMNSCFTSLKAQEMKSKISGMISGYKDDIESVKKRLDEINSDIIFAEKTLKNIPDLGIFKYVFEPSQRIDNTLDENAQEILDFSNSRLEYTVSTQNITKTNLVINCKAAIRFGIWKYLLDYFSVIMIRLKQFSNTV